MYALIPLSTWARGHAKVWRADYLNVSEDPKTGKWVAAKDGQGAPYKVDNLINHSIFPVILAARDLNSHVEIVEEDEAPSSSN